MPRGRREAREIAGHRVRGEGGGEPSRTQVVGEGGNEPVAQEIPDERSTGDLEERQKHVRCRTTERSDEEQAVQALRPGERLDQRRRRSDRMGCEHDPVEAEGIEHVGEPGTLRDRAACQGSSGSLRPYPGLSMAMSRRSGKRVAMAAKTSCAKLPQPCRITTGGPSPSSIRCTVLLPTLNLRPTSGSCVTIASLASLQPLPSPTSRHRRRFPGFSECAKTCRKDVRSRPMCLDSNRIFSHRTSLRAEINVSFSSCMQDA